MNVLTDLKRLRTAFSKGIISLKSFCVLFSILIFENSAYSQEQYQPVYLRIDDNSGVDKGIAENRKEEIINQIQLFLGKYKEIASLKDYNAPGKPGITKDIQLKFKGLFDNDFNSEIYDDLSFKPAIIKVSDYTDKVFQGFPDGLTFDIRDAYLQSITDEGEFYEATVKIAKVLYQGYNKKNESVQYEKGRNPVSEDLILTINKTSLGKIKINKIRGPIAIVTPEKEQFILANIRYGFGLPGYSTGVSFNSKDAISLVPDLLLSLGGEFRIALKNKGKISARIGLYYSLSNYKIKINEEAEVNYRSETLEGGINGKWKNTLYVDEATDYIFNSTNLEIPVGINWKIKDQFYSNFNVELSFINNLGLSQSGKLKGSFSKRIFQDDIEPSPALCDILITDANQDIQYEKKTYSYGIRAGIAWHRNLIRDKVQWFVLADYTHYLQSITLGDHSNGITDNNTEINGFKFGLPDIKPHQLNISVGLLFWINKKTY